MSYIKGWSARKGFWREINLSLIFLRFLYFLIGFPNILKFIYLGMLNNIDFTLRKKIYSNIIHTINRYSKCAFQHIKTWVQLYAAYFLKDTLPFLHVILRLKRWNVQVTITNKKFFTMSLNLLSGIDLSRCQEWNKMLDLSMFSFLFIFSEIVVESPTTEKWVLKMRYICFIEAFLLKEWCAVLFMKIGRARENYSSLRKTNAICFLLLRAPRLYTEMQNHRCIWQESSRESRQEGKGNYWEGSRGECGRRRLQGGKNLQVQFICLNCNKQTNK